MPVEYQIGDALQVLKSEPSRTADLIHLDDGWARPNRNGGFGVTYPTHPFDSGEATLVEGEPGVTTDITCEELISECLRLLVSNGLLIVDTDAYLLPKVLSYLEDEVCSSTFKTGFVTLLTNDGRPDRSTPGQYGSSGGYTSVLIWKEAAPVLHGGFEDRHALTCPCRRQRESYGWSTVKPLAPYEMWVDTYTSPGDRIIVPCAGTAPTAIAAELLHGDRADVLCVDIEQEAQHAYERRRSDELKRQSSLTQFR